MKVLKFGGTSVGSPERMKKLLDIIDPAERQVVVLSAAALINRHAQIGTLSAGKIEVVRLSEASGPPSPQKPPSVPSGMRQPPLREER